jgi:hypothetical protein
MRLEYTNEKEGLRVSRRLNGKEARHPLYPQGESTNYAGRSVLPSGPGKWTNNSTLDGQKYPQKLGDIAQSSMLRGRKMVEWMFRIFCISYSEVYTRKV